MSFSISDIDKLGKLSGLLVIPLIAAALYTEFGWWAVAYDETILRHLKSDNYFVFLISNALVFGASVVIVALVYFLVNGYTGNHKGFRLVLGLTLLTYGVLGLGAVLDVVLNISSSESAPRSNLYAHLAALAWGFEIFSIEESNTNQKNQADA